MVRRGGVATLMTLHTAKGPGAPVVFLTGLEDGIFPHLRSLGDPTELEEERRLAYVGITRAQQRLYLSRSIVRSAWGAPQPNPASRFLQEIPDELVTGAAWSRRCPARRRSRRWRPAAGRSPGNRAVVHLEPGDRVTPTSFGFGRVVAVEGGRARGRVDRFPFPRRQAAAAAYAPVEKL